MLPARGTCPVRTSVDALKNPRGIVGQLRVRLTKGWKGG
jgi:hypothetical protein